MKKICLIVFGGLLTLCFQGCSTVAIEWREASLLEQNCMEDESEYLNEQRQCVTVTPGVTEEEQGKLPRAYRCISEESMPVIRNQAGSNTCWAFASLSALESSNENLSKEAYSVDHLRYHNPFGDSFENGGSYVVPVSYLVSWMGPVKEEEDPFDGSSPEGLTPAVHVQEIRQSEPRDFETIKQFVYRYGGVESALYLDFNEFMQSSECYDEANFSYCYQGEEISNHDVVIIGWDDDYPAENFVGNVTSNGAFLCLNSWGSQFGNQGCFYVSYEDVNIGGYGVVYSRIDSTDNYDFIFQSDLCGFTAQIGFGKEACWFANAYTSTEPIQLRAAGVYATGKGSNYEVYVVEEFEDTKSFKNKQLICKGKLEDAGYYTIDFPKEIFIKGETKFAVVVKIQTEGAEYPVAIECPVKDLSELADLSDGEGYLSAQGITWEHIEETKNYNICLKVYADRDE